LQNVHKCSHKVLYFLLTIWEQSSNRTEEERTMAHQIRSVIARSRDTLLGDAVGVAALMVMLIVGLSLPGLV
jgi:hypothetical protein